MTRARRQSCAVPVSTRDLAVSGNNWESASHRRDSNSVFDAKAEECALMLTTLNQASSLEELLSALPRSAAELAGTGDAFVVLGRDSTGQLDPASLRLCNPASKICVSDLQACLDSRPELWGTLIGGFPVSVYPAGRSPQQESRVGETLLVPLVSRSDFQGLLGVIFGGHAPRIRTMELNLLHQLGRRVGPMIARLRELENLRRQNAELSRSVAVQRDAPSNGTESPALAGRVVEMPSQVLSNIAHELRTPLVAIRGYTRMILQGTAGDINSTQREYLSIVAENTNRLVQLIGALARTTAPRQLRKQTFDLRDLWQECLRLIRPQVTHKGIVITERVPEEPVLVSGDRERLAQVFHVLLCNAVRFTDSGGEIVVELTSVAEQVTVTVTDTGVGIPHELLDKLFDRYRPPDGSSTPGPEAGLSAVRETLRLHGGKISVTSKVGEGSTFVFTLPAASANQQQEDQSGNEQASHPSSG